MWLAARTDFPLIGHWFTEEWAAYVFSYGGLLLDLLFVPFVLWRRTRPVALCVALVFHLMNSRLFSIGIFPWFMIAANLLFLNPGWPRIILRRGRLVAAPAVYPRLVLRVRERAIVAILGVYFAAQILLPLRHHLYPGDVHWTEEGHYFSWRMKLRDKTGQAQFFVTDPVSQSSWEVDPFAYVTKRQYGEMVGQPDMILQLAQHIARSLREQGYPQIEVRVWVGVSLNGRNPQVLIDPAIDLAAQPRSLLAAHWIVPLTEPLTVGRRGAEMNTEDESDN
jgi:vitamin K-dependent gamma-carboxylase